MDLSKAKEYLHLVQAAAEGKAIQMKMGDNEWMYLKNSDFSCGADQYRIKTEPILRPWKPEEVPVGCLLRIKIRDVEATYNKFVITSLHVDMIGYGNSGFYNIKALLNDCEHSLDHGKTWLPCGVVE